MFVKIPGVILWTDLSVFEDGGPEEPTILMVETNWPVRQEQWHWNLKSKRTMCFGKAKRTMCFEPCKEMI